MIPFLSLKDVTALHGAEINEAVTRVVNGGWYLQGAENEKFEKDYAEYIGTKYAIGCANGLDALIWIFRAYIEMGVMKPGDEVIVPANTYIATILAITENGLVPVLCEPKLNTLEIDDDLIEGLITPKTKAIVVVHLYGRIANTPKILDLCKKYNLKLVEDNAQAHGCRYRPTGQRAGSIGDAAGHSFYPGKNLGALVLCRSVSAHIVIVHEIGGSCDEECGSSVFEALPGHYFCIYHTLDAFVVGTFYCICSVAPCTFLRAVVNDDDLL